MRQRGPATIYEVAERAGVSISTVSLAINQPEKVRDVTRRRVIEVAGELGYRPRQDVFARSRRAVQRIAVLAPFTSYASYRDRLAGILTELEGSGSEVIVYDHPSSAAVESPTLDAIPVRGDVSGLIIMGIPLGDRAAERLRELGPPAVLVDTEDHAFSSVRYDNERGGLLVGRHLLARGHRHIAFVQERQRSAGYLSAGALRTRGVQHALDEAGGEAAGLRLTRAEIDLTERDHALSALIDSLRRQADQPTAIFANHDTIAAGLIAAARESGLGIPRDLAIVGFDDGVLAESLALTTVRQPLEESGAVAARLLSELIADPSSSRREISLGCELMVRSTT